MNTTRPGLVVIAWILCGLSVGLVAASLVLSSQLLGGHIEWADAANDWDVYVLDEAGARASAPSSTMPRPRPAAAPSSMKASR